MATTYFDSIKRSYTDVEIADGINTEQFLEATEGVVKLFGKKYIYIKCWHNMKGKKEEQRYREKIG